jgi:hypothetical protein
MPGPLSRPPPKSEEPDRQVPIDPGTVMVLREWRKGQLAERLAWGSTVSFTMDELADAAAAAIAALIPRRSRPKDR